MKPTQAARTATAQNKVEANVEDVHEEERSLPVGAEPYRTPTQQSTRPASAVPNVVTDAEASRVSARSAAELERGRPASSTQGARSGPVRGGGGRGGSGGGSGFKGNRGFKGATPFDPYSSMNLNVYAKGGQVGKVGSFGMKRSKPDFAGGGDKTNFKMSTKKGKMPW